MLDGDVRQFRHLDVPWVGHDEFRPACSGPKNPFGRYGVVFGGIGPDDENTLGFGEFRQGVGHRPRTKSRGQTDHGGTVSEPGAVVYIIGTDGRAGKFIQQEVFFIGNLGRGKDAHGIGAMGIHYLLQPLGRRVQGFVPSRHR